MPVNVREMTLAEVDIIIDYFHQATPEFLDMLGVDPTRLPSRRDWRARYESEYEKPVDQRRAILLLWLSDDAAVGFSTADKITFGEQANMHLHVAEADLRNSGLGAESVKLSAEIYFDKLKLKRLFCEPNAFNTAPNRTLQRAGFRYLKTYMTVPGPLNYRQAVTRWVLER